MIKEHLIISVDFDATLVDSEYPKIIGLKPWAKEVMTKWYNQGIYLIINTCRNGEAEWECETFLFENRVPYHKVNDHSPFIKQKYFNPHHPISRKLLSQINIDDTSLNYMLGDIINWPLIDMNVQDIIAKGKWNVEPDYNYINV
jgi:hypothetical protein